MKVSTGTIVRTIVLFLAWMNQILTTQGYNPLPWSEDALYEGISLAITAAISLVSWWKNNSFTKAAIQADAMRKQGKEELAP